MKSLSVKLGVILLAIGFIFGYGEVWGTDEGTVVIHRGFIKGNDYLKAETGKRRFYGMGIIDGITLAPFFGAPKSKMIWFEKCVENMTDNQVEAIITNYLENHPGEWHHDLHLITLNAFQESCQK